MVKKNVKIASKTKPISQKKIQLMLIENFVKMQQVQSNLTVKFDLLADNISRLLGLIEISAKSFVEKQEIEKDMLTKGDKDLLEKLDSLVDQNKTIARGLTLVEEKLRHKLYGETILPSGLQTHHLVKHPGRPETAQEQEKSRPRPLPRL